MGCMTEEKQSPERRPIPPNCILRLMQKYHVRVYPDLTGESPVWYAGKVTCKSGVNFVQLHHISDPAPTPEEAAADLVAKMGWDIWV